MPRRSGVAHKLTDVCNETGISREVVVQCVREEWISPVQHSTQNVDDWDLDDEDIARVRLIQELRKDFGVNDESIPIILHLLDQLLSVIDIIKKNS